MKKESLATPSGPTKPASGHLSLETKNRLKSKKVKKQDVAEGWSHPLGKAKQEFELKYNTPEKLLQQFKDILQLYQQRHGYDNPKKFGSLMNLKTRAGVPDMDPIEFIARNKAWSYGYGRLNPIYWNQIKSLVQPEQNKDKENFDKGVSEAKAKKQRLDPKCWTGYRKAGTKVKGDTLVNKCVKVKENINESISLKTTIASIVNNGKYIAELYELLKVMASHYVDNRGDLKGFSMMAGGQGSRWYQNFYFNKLQGELYDLYNQTGKTSQDLINFLNSEGTSRGGHKSFTQIAEELPEILQKIALRIKSDELLKFAKSWRQRDNDYRTHLANIEAGVESDDDNEEPGEPKDNIIGQQNSQVDSIINQAIKDNIPKKFQGDVRNKLNRLPVNARLGALQAEINKYKASESINFRKCIKISEGWSNEMAKLITLLENK